MTSKIQYRIKYNPHSYWCSTYYGERYYPQYRTKTFLFWSWWTDLCPATRNKPRGVPQRKQADYAIAKHKLAHKSKEVVV